MALLSLAKSIENIDSPEQAKVLAVINHLMPTLANWRQGEDLRDAISGLEANISGCKAELDATKAELVALTCPQSPYQSKFQKSVVCKIN